MNFQLPNGGIRGQWLGAYEVAILSDYATAIKNREPGPIRQVLGCSVVLACAATVALQDNPIFATPRQADIYDRIHHLANTSVAARILPASVLKTPLLRTSKENFSAVCRIAAAVPEMQYGDLKPGHAIGLLRERGRVLSGLGHDAAAFADLAVRYIASDAP